MTELLPLVLSGLLTLTQPSADAPSVPKRPVTAEALLTAPDRHVRTTDRHVLNLLTQGVRRSTTFANLMQQLNQSDVIVYIQAVDTLPSTLAGRLMLAADAHGQRYLRVQVRQTLTPNESIALMAHEFRHALEIAAASEVRDARGLIALYQRIGDESLPGMHAYETDAAQDVGRQVRVELLHAVTADATPSSGPSLLALRTCVATDGSCE
jgi:hypothetical protein